MRRAAWVCLLLMVGCSAPTTATQSVDQYFVLRRAYLHPAVPIAEWALDKPFGENLDNVFEQASCNGLLASLILRVRVDIEAGRGLGDLDLLIGTTVGSGDLCGGDGTAVVQAFSFRDLESRTPFVRGPVFVEGRTLDARLNLGDFQIFGTGLGALPSWWSLRADVEGNRTDRPGEEQMMPLDDALRLSNAEARTVWGVGLLQQQVLEPMRMSPADPGIYPFGTAALELLVAEGLQPDVDVDGDGLERLESDGTTELAPAPISRCVDGDGTVIEGADCVFDPRIVDGFEVVMVFRLLPVTIENR